MPELVEAAVKKNYLNRNELSAIHGFLKTVAPHETGRRTLEDVPVLPFSTKNLRPALGYKRGDMTGLLDVHGNPVDAIFDLHLGRLVFLGAAHWEFKRPGGQEARLVIKRSWVNAIRAWAQEHLT